MNNDKNQNKYNLKHKVLKDLYTFLVQSIHIRYVNFNRFNNISSFDKCKCLILSKNIYNYIKSKNINIVNTTTLLDIINKNIKNNQQLKLYKKNIELIKFYTILFSEKNCSHLTFYLFNNSKLSIVNEENACLSIVIAKTGKYSIVLNEHLNIFKIKRCSHKKGDIFLYKKPKKFSLKPKLYLSMFSIIVAYSLLFNIPNNYIIMEMNVTMHMKMNHNGYILSYRPKSKLAKTMIKQNKQYIRKLHKSVPSFINYALDNNILKPGQDVKIYIIGPPLNRKFCERLEESMKGTPINIIINNSGKLLKINST